MHHKEFIASYDVPVADGRAPRPEPVWARRGEGRLRTLAGQAQRRTRGRRLAYVDSHFPWQRSGFRYADAAALHRLRPDTVFFSMYELTDPFPAPVLPLAQFPRLAPALGITDIYGVFLDFMAGVLGLRRHTAHEPGVIEGLDLSGVLARLEIRSHVGLYPGGGFVATEEGFEAARQLVATADTTFSWSPALLRAVDGVIEIAPAIIDTGFYAEIRHEFGDRPLELLFVADDKPRKGLGVALRALERLDDAPVHLHVVGPHEPAQWTGPAERVTFHGWLGRDALRGLHQRCHVFLSPVSAESPDDAKGDGGITDGFPTAAASEAMSSGLLLCSANPDADHRFLTPSQDYLEVAADAASFEDAIRAVLAGLEPAAALAASGAGAVRAHLDVVQGARMRLAAMGFNGGRTPWRRVRRTVVPSSGPTPPASQLTEILAALARVEETQVRIREELATTREGLAAAFEAGRGELTAIGQLVLDDETAATTELWKARARPDYAAPFEESEPLVTVCIPTYTNVERLVDRSLPSVLSQDYERLEVIVVGDDAPGSTARAIAQIGDPRVRYEHLNLRGPYPDDPRRRWFVAGIPALNRGLELARGSWFVINNDDDALRPGHVSRLLAAARGARAEVAYGQFLIHSPDGTTTLDGAFPPRSHAFGWQLAIQHRALRMFRYKLSASLFDSPGDWDRARRMMRAGVRFHMIDEVVFDYYPSTLWRGDDSLPEA
jgi:glycosyltransferase involved in cell wall biosynthesis